MIHALKLDLHDCLKAKNFVYTVLAAGLQEAYGELKTPVDALSYVRPVIAVLYLFIAARFFMVAVDRGKASAVVGMVCLAAVAATAANALGVGLLGLENCDLKLYRTTRKRTVWPRSQSRVDAESLCAGHRERPQQQRVVGCIGTGRRALAPLQQSFQETDGYELF
jgi:hypothetical protein